MQPLSYSIMPICLKDLALSLLIAAATCSSHHIRGQHLLCINTLSISRTQMDSPTRVEVSCCTQHNNTYVRFHHAGISEAQTNVDRLRQILESVITGVQEGRAEQQHQRQLALSRRQKPVSYSPWLSQPFLKVCSSYVFCCCPSPLQASSRQNACTKHDLPQAYLACHSDCWLSWMVACLACP